MDYIALLEKEIAPYKKQLSQHPVYTALREIEDIQTFMELHVYAVWDFMSLLKSLQHTLTCVQIPWKPVANPKTARFINEIVLGEESDVNEKGEPKSHFEMYLDAMKEVQADCLPILQFVDQINSLSDIDEKLKNSPLPQEAIEFLRFTFQTIATQESHKIASAFTFGREDLIPDMFIEIINHSENQAASKFPKLRYYLERHIELDGDDHGPLSIEMIRELCQQDENKWIEVIDIAKSALKARIVLWDGILATMETRKTMGVMG